MEGPDRALGLPGKTTLTLMGCPPEEWQAVGQVLRCKIREESVLLQVLLVYDRHTNLAGNKKLCAPLRWVFGMG